MSKVKNFYAGSNSSIGFYSLYDEALKDLETLYILKGGPGTGKSSFMKKVGSAVAQAGYNIEVLHCSSDNKSIDGIIIPALKIGFVDGTAPHIVDPKYPGVVDKIINLGDYRDDTKLKQHREEIVQLTDEISDCFREAYQKFADAKKVHLKKEEIYIEAMDFNKADEITQHLMEKIFERTADPGKNNKSRKIFFGAATPEGPVNYIDNITEDVAKRYIIKGRSGSGKSTLMKRIAKKAESMDLNVETYYCAFDPNSVDMIIIPSLDVAVLDGTAPHVIDATRANDEIIDMFELCIDKTVEVERREEIKELESRYKHIMRLGTASLQKAKDLHDRLEAYYIAAMDFAAIDRRQEELLEEIFAATRQP
ncbi:PRK06851 family protein [Pseudalkalibacillus caeni]|uniref:ATPase n=1 Tax=Exobacillus caeni TaxID=2574798 RepID=A0A5R9FDP0_9BACL|nr:PRK06851 family protein [Pseudalkalibacillus caeni]TLS38993.1 hypothetical protein FCL54_01395 [Pseudalkalibacillus caeni]